MFRNHIKFVFLSVFAVVFIVLLFNRCSTNKLPPDSYLLSKNNFKYTDKKLFNEEIKNFVLQNPNTSTLGMPLGLWFYNMANPKYDSIIRLYKTYPSDSRNQKLRDSLFIKFNKPEWKGKSLFWNIMFHSYGEEPVIYDGTLAQKSATDIKKYLAYRGYFQGQVSHDVRKDSLQKRIEVNYNIKHNEPTRISSYQLNIPDAAIQKLYADNIVDAKIKTGDVLDQVKLQEEINRFTKIARNEGYYSFNQNNDEIYFDADSTAVKRHIPLSISIKKNDSIQKPYQISRYDSINVYIREGKPTKMALNEFTDYQKGVKLHRTKDDINPDIIRSSIVFKPGYSYNETNEMATRRKLSALNNFSVYAFKTKANVNGMLETEIYLKPLKRYELRYGADLHYSQVLNLGVSPTLELVARNVFGGAENFKTSFSGIAGTTATGVAQKKWFNAYELSWQNSLTFPNLRLPISINKYIPDTWVTNSSINFGASMQQSIGLGRITINLGYQLFANVNGIVSHQLNLFNTQFNFATNKDNYFSIFSSDKDLRDKVFDFYSNDGFDVGDYNDNAVDKFQGLINNQETRDTFYTMPTALQRSYLQIYNRLDRQVEPVFINSIIYQYSYNEIGQVDKENPIFINFKSEFAGNLLRGIDRLLKKDDFEGEAAKGHTLFKATYSQFAKFDLEFKKYQNLGHKQQLVFRQYIGVGLPYGNSNYLPVVRTYFNGGVNDLRAWRAFETLDPNGNNASPLGYGDIKLTTNLEYRFPVFKIVEGALFTDIGNVWDSFKSEDPFAFRLNNFYKELAIGSGLGVRFNLNYFVLRIDMAYKMYNPGNNEGERWVIKNIKPLQPSFNFALNYPF